MRNLLLPFLFLVACGGSPVVPADKDAGPTADINAPSPDFPIGIPTGAVCSTDADCDSNVQLCAFALADGCSAVGHCMAIPTPTCANIEQLCGCDGKPVPGGACFYANGYAGGQTTGATYEECGDAGTRP